MDKPIIVKTSKKPINKTVEVLKDIQKALDRIAEELSVMNERAMQKEDIYG